MKTVERTFSGRSSTCSTRRVGTLCSYNIRRRQRTVCILCKTMEQYDVIVHLPDAARSAITTFCCTNSEQISASLVTN